MEEPSDLTSPYLPLAHLVVASVTVVVEAASAEASEETAVVSEEASEEAIEAVSAVETEAASEEAEVDLEEATPHVLPTRASSSPHPTRAKSSERAQMVPFESLQIVPNVIPIYSVAHSVNRVCAV